MAMFHLLKIRTSKDIFSNEKCKVTFGLKYIMVTMAWSYSYTGGYGRSLSLHLTYCILGYFS